MRSLTASAAVDAGKGAALTVVLSLVVGFVPVISVLAIPLIPLPTSYVTTKWGFRTGLVLAVVASVLSWLFAGPTNGVFTFVLAGGLGTMLGTGLRRNWGISRLLWASAFAAGLGLAVWLGLSWFLSGLTPSQLTSIMETSFQTVSGVYEGAGVDQASIEESLAAARGVVVLLPYLLPGIIMSLGLVLAVTAGALAAVILPRLGRVLPESMSLRGLRLHWATPYGFIVGLALILAGSWLGETGRWLWLIGANLALFFATVFFVQGVALTQWLVEVRTRSAGQRLGFYALALMGQFLFLLLTWVGLLDIWLDFRTRYSRRWPQTPDSTPVGSRRDGDEEETEWK